MEIIQVFEDGILDIRIAGEVDAHSSIELDAVIQDAVNKKLAKIMVDCNGLSYISSAGLGVFISHLEDMKGYGGRFVFYKMNPAVYNIFEILGLHTIMEVVEDKREAKMLVNES